MWSIAHFLKPDLVQRAYQTQRRGSKAERVTQEYPEEGDKGGNDIALNGSG